MSNNRRKKVEEKRGASDPSRTGVNLLPPQRHREILASMETNGSVRVTHLARRMGVTEETIRRDLEKLGADGQLVRIHGGAVSVRQERQKVPFDARKSTNHKANRRIAGKAVAYIDEGDVIALDGSTTALELARIIPDMPITVITNALAIASTLLDRKLVRVVSTGGQLDRDSACFVGSMAEEGLERFNILKFFFSCRGIDLERGLSEACDQHASIKRRMLKLANRSYLLADPSKCQVRSMVFFAGVGDVDVMITDDKIDASFVEAIQGDGVEVVVAD